MSILSSEWLQLIRNNIDEFGSTVTVRAVSRSFGEDEYRIKNETTEDTVSVKAVPQVMSLEDEHVAEGTFRAGDFRFFFKDSRSGIVDSGNRIQYNSAWYEIVEVDEHELEDTIYVVEARTRKI